MKQSEEHNEEGQKNNIFWDLSVVSRQRGGGGRGVDVCKGCIHVSVYAR